MVAVISGGVTLLGVLLSNGRRQAVAETRLETLVEEVRELGGFAQRLPVVEEQIKGIHRRIGDLEKRTEGIR